MAEKWQTDRKMAEKWQENGEIRQTFKGTFFFVLHCKFICLWTFIVIIYKMFHAHWTGGYYTIERKRTKLQLVALNTNLCTMEGEDPAGQWEWLEGVLNKSRSKNETVSVNLALTPNSLTYYLFTQPFECNNHLMTYVLKLFSSFFINFNIIAMLKLNNKEIRWNW